MSIGHSRSIEKCSYEHRPRKERLERLERLLVLTNGIDLLAVGNGSGCRSVVRYEDLRIWADALTTYKLDRRHSEGPTNRLTYSRRLSKTTVRLMDRSA